MTRILFWNVNKKPLLSEITSLCHGSKANILVLAEYELYGVAILQAVNSNLERKYLSPVNPSSYLSFFYKTHLRSTHKLIF